jgi:hypothetical protein
MSEISVRRVLPATVTLTEIKNGLSSQTKAAEKTKQIIDRYDHASFIGKTLR